MSKELARAIASSLLIYPDEKFEGNRDQLKTLAESLDPEYQIPLLAFLSKTESMLLSELQTHYVEIFDMRRRCSLFLTSWTHGDTRNRGMALIYFSQKYKEFGFALSDEELPDHLSVVLEFAALCDPKEGEMLLAEHHAPLLLIREALAEAKSIYSNVLDVIIASLPEINDEIRERARALAITGPPKEFVGLSGAVSIALQPFSMSTSSNYEGANS